MDQTHNLRYRGAEPRGPTIKYNWSITINSTHKINGRLVAAMDIDAAATPLTLCGEIKCSTFQKM